MPVLPYMGERTCVLLQYVTYPARGIQRLFYISVRSAMLLLTEEIRIVLVVYFRTY